MVKFKGRLDMKQYVKNKSLKWGFKFRHRCTSKSGYLYHFDLYLEKKENAKENLGGSIVLVLTECIKYTNCPIFFDSFFNSPLLIAKLFDKGVYAVETTRENRKDMSEITSIKNIKRDDDERLFSEKMDCCKWFDNLSVTVLFHNFEGMATASTTP